MTTGKVIFLSAITTIVGTLVVGKTGIKAPGFSR